MTETSFTVRVLPEGMKVRVKAGEILADVLSRAGIPLSLYCHKRAVCGRCAVRIVSGPLPFPTSAEESLLGEGRLNADERLACLYEVRGDVTIETLPGSRLEKLRVLETGPDVSVLPDPAVKKFSLSLTRPSLYSPEAAGDSLVAALKLASPPPLSVLTKLGTWAPSSPATVTAVVYGDQELMDIEPGDSRSETYGLAVDLGTTTVVAEIVDLVTGRTVERVASVNAQNAYGADVVSRITFAFENPANLARLKSAIVQLLNDMVTGLVRSSGVSRHRIYEAVVAGNTVMNHILCGVAVDSLALAPFHAVFTRVPAFPASEIGLTLNPQARVFIVPNIKSFVGGDIVAGLVATEMASRSGTELYVDLGTNGEIVLKKGRELLATSTAAGPAFEGLNISCGMLAVPGAIYRAEWSGGFRLSTVDDVPPQGICGSGLIDVLAASLDRSFLDRAGKVLAADKRIRLTERLALTQQDVREVQLAVGAIRTGIRLMLREGRTVPHELDRILVAGAFGASLDVRNSQAIGLLPELPERKIVFVGNASLAGARRLLLSLPSRADAEALSRRVGHVSLAARTDFQDEFVASLEFKPFGGDAA